MLRRTFLQMIGAAPLAALTALRPWSPWQSTTLIDAERWFGLSGNIDSGTVRIYGDVHDLYPIAVEPFTPSTETFDFRQSE